MKRIFGWFRRKPQVPCELCGKESLKVLALPGHPLCGEHFAFVTGAVHAWITTTNDADHLTLDQMYKTVIKVRREEINRS